MKIITINSLEDFSEKNIALIKETIDTGNLLIYPTDTVYGLGASIKINSALKKVYIAKSRQFSSPLIALISSIKKVEELAEISDLNREKLYKLADVFWPGALTVILNKKECVPDIMVSGGNTVGIRIPNSEIALKIIEIAGGILPTTSANISGENTPTSFEEISDKIRANVNLLIDSGKCELGEASTIIDLTKKKPLLLRKGAISIKEITKIIGEIEVKE